MTLLMKLKQGLEDVLETEELEYIDGTQHMVSSRILLSCGRMIIRILRLWMTRLFQGILLRMMVELNLLFCCNQSNFWIRCLSHAPLTWCFIHNPGNFTW